jgi:hypothetical protein
LDFINDTGIEAKGILDIFSVFVSVATPTVDKTPPAKKLTVTEKHFYSILFYTDFIS